MTITVTASVFSNGFGGNNFGRNNIEHYILTAVSGSFLNTQGLYENHTANATADYLTQTITLDDPATGSTNNYLRFTDSTGSRFQHGIMANLVNDGGLSSDDSYQIRGLRLAGTATTITSFNMGLSLYVNPTAIFPNPPDYTPTSLVDITGPAGDDYFVNHSGLPNFWSGFNWNLTQFLAAATALRAGDGSLLAAMLNAESFNFRGSTSGDSFQGYDQNDRLKGSYGHDKLSGGNGDDDIDGGSGNDTLNGEGDNDHIDGGDGNDTIDGGDGNDIIEGGAGTNTIQGGDGDDLFILGEGADLISDVGGIDTVRFTSASTINFVDGFGLGDPSNDLWDDDFIERFEGSSGDDAIILTFAGGGPKEIFGFGGNDVLGGRADKDAIFGGSGHDALYGRDGRDTIMGESGNDNLNGDAGNDILVGGRGNDTLNGGANADTADFSDHFGNASKGWFINLLTQTATTEFSTISVLITETDTMSGIETAIGSSGRDTFYTAPRSTVYGGTGVDTLVLAPTRPFADFTQAADDRVDIALGISERGPIFISNPETVRFHDIEIIHTNLGNDSVSGSDFADIVYGDEGNDSISGLGGSDKIFGGSGADRLTGGDGNDSFGYTSLAEGADSITDFHNDLGDNDRFTFEQADVGNLGVEVNGVTELNALHFQASSDSNATTTDIRFIYDTDDGTLSYDSDGSGGNAAVLIATLQNLPSLTASDIVLI